MKFVESKETHNQQLGNYYQSVHLRYDSNSYSNSYHILNTTHALNHHGIANLENKCIDYCFFIFLFFQIKMSVFIYLIFLTFNFILAYKHLTIL